MPSGHTMLALWLLSLTAIATANAQAPPADPMAQFRADLEGRLRKHAFFARIDFECDARYPPFLFYVQTPAKKDEGYVARVVDAHVPMLRKVLATFEATYVGPLELKRQALAPGFAVAILNSRGMYDNYAQVTQTESLHSARAHYDPFVRIAVSYQNSFSHDDPNAIKHEESHALLHEIVHALQHAYSRDARMPMGLWFVEGLAEYQAARESRAKGYDGPCVDTERLTVLAATYLRPELQHHLSGVDELLGILSYDEVRRRARQRAALRDEAMHDDGLALGAFYAQAAMFVQFLHEAESARHRPAFLACMRALMAGTNCRTAVAAGFGEKPDFAELDRQFRGWLTTAIRDRAHLQIPDLVPKQEKANVDAAAKPAPPITFDPSTVAWRGDEVDLRLDAAMQLCAAGDYDAALRVLPGAGDAIPEPAVSRAGRERARVEAAAKLRDRVLADLMGGKAEVDVSLAGAPTKVRVVARDGDLLRVSARGSEQVVPLTTLAPAILLQHSWRKRWLADDERWLDRWLRWLTCSPFEKLKPMLAGQDKNLVALRGDVTATFVADPTLSQAVAVLDALQRAPLPDAPAEAWARFTALRDALRAHGKHAMFGSRRAALTTAVQALVQRGHDPANLSGLGLSGKVETLGEGRFRVTYEGDAHAAFDLVPEHAYLERLPREAVAIAYAREASIRAGAKGWEIIGAGFFRWPIPLTGRQVIDLDQSQSAQGNLEVLLCDDGEGNNLSATSMGLTILDRARNILDQRRDQDAPSGIYPNRSYRLRVEHDGTSNVKVTLDGKTVATCENPGTRSHGGLGVYVYSSNPLTVHRLVIEGEVDPAALPALRTRLVESVLALLGPDGR